jgi:outer membrane immunogenic protein
MGSVQLRRPGRRFRHDGRAFSRVRLCAVATGAAALSCGANTAPPSGGPVLIQPARITGQIRENDMRILFSAAAAATAFAATPAFAERANANFSGGHVEAIAGYDDVRGGGDGRDGLLYGIGAGYDLRTGNAVFGIEGEAADSSTGDCVATICVEAGRDLYVGGRVGVVVSPNLLLYGKLGYTNARVVATSATLRDGTNLDGIRAGTGVEWAIPHTPLSLRAEYRYSNYEAGISRHQGVAGLAFRF